MDFETQIKMFTEQIADMLEMAKEQAGLDFQNERSNWEQTERSFVGTVRDMEQEIERLKGERDEAKSALYDLKEKLSGLV